MPAYITQPSTQPFPPTTIPVAGSAQPSYCWGIYSPYADAPLLNVEHAEAVPVNGTSSLQFAIRSYSGENQNSPAITWETEFPSLSAFTLTAAANASAGVTVYTGTITGGAANAFYGYKFTVAGFVTGANNGAFTCTASTATTLTLANAAGVAEAHAGTATGPAAPATIDIRLQGALRDKDAEYFDLDKSTNAAGEMRTVAMGQVRVNFVRIKVVASTGGTLPTLVAKFQI